MGGAERGRDEGGLDTGGADKSRRTGREAELMGRERKRTEFRQREIHVCFPSRFIFTVFTLQVKTKPLILTGISGRFLLFSFFLKIIYFICVIMIFR